MTSAIWAMLGAFLAVWIVGRVPVFQKAYSAQLQRQTDNHWLRAQCSEPSFFMHLRQHTDVCFKVRETFDQPPVMAGIEACFPEDIREWMPAPGWRGFILACLACVILSPTLLLPSWQVWMSRKHADNLRHLTLTGQGAKHMV